MNNLSEEDAMLAGKAVNSFIRRMDGAENRAGTAGQALFYILFNLHGAHYLGDPKEFSEHAALTFLLFLSEYGRGEDARGVIENLRLACDNAERMMAAAQLAGSAPDDGPKPATGAPGTIEADQDTWLHRFEVLISSHGQDGETEANKVLFYYGKTPLVAAISHREGFAPCEFPLNECPEVTRNEAGQEENLIGQTWLDYAEEFATGLATYQDQEPPFRWSDAIPWFRRGTDPGEAIRHHVNGTDPETIPLLSEQDTDTNNG